jgi:hypothetical protein
MVEFINTPPSPFRVGLAFGDRGGNALLKQQYGDAFPMRKRSQLLANTSQISQELRGFFNREAWPLRRQQLTQGG